MISLENYIGVHIGSTHTTHIFVSYVRNTIGGAIGNPNHVELMTKVNKRDTLITA